MATSWLLPGFLVRAAAGLTNGMGSSLVSQPNGAPAIPTGGFSVAATSSKDGATWEEDGCSREGIGSSESDDGDMHCSTLCHLAREEDSSSLLKINPDDQMREKDEAILTAQMLDCCAEVGERLRELVIEKKWPKESMWKLGQVTEGGPKVNCGTQSDSLRVSRGTQSCTGVLHYVEDYMEEVYCVAKVLTDPNASETKILEGLGKLESLPISTAVLEYLLAIRHYRLERCPSGDMWLCCWPWAKAASPRTKTNQSTI